MRGPGQAVVFQFLAQRGPVDAQQGGGTALVAFAVVQHFHEQRDFHFTQHDFVDVVGVAAIQIAQVASHGLRHMIAQRWFWIATTSVVTSGGVH